MSRGPRHGTLTTVRTKVAPSQSAPGAAEIDPRAIGAAETLAAGAARLGGVQVRTVADAVEQHRASEVLQHIWQQDGGSPLPSALLRAFDFTGNYVGAAYDGDTIVGVAIGFHTDHGALHSHIAGVLADYRGRSVGYVLKLHQRAWALRHGIDTIAWTFDPLVRRNAHFNLVKLGAAAAGFLPDFYGAMADAVNSGDRSDRLLAEWNLLAAVPGSPVDPPAGTQPALVVAAAEEPVLTPTDGRARTIEIPPDIERIRLEQPELAARWRRALRTALRDALTDGHRIAGLSHNNAYITVKEEP